MSDKERIKEIIDSSNMSVRKFSEHIGLKTPQILYDIIKERNGISKDLAEKITAKCLNYNFAWVLTGNGEKLKEEPIVSHLIPFFDAATVGGVNCLSADMCGISHAFEYIDTGDWFRDATAALRHYGDSMAEYPSGCILVLKEVIDRELIIPGRDYMIETSEYRVTKRIQKGKDADHITAYSTNTETYPDGRLIHEPFDIPWRSIRQIALVLGFVVTKDGGATVYSNK
ncbi:MAG: helix-turn-helix domain-containing protein [Tannerellaceae bacterium]|jgi:hypothetical protein|nr:helix-turn-helix domain-containing protein [Tannerellaceae bacterium]